MSPGRTRLGMAGTTRLELATSAVTVSGLSVLSTTWKSPDGIRSHWKYVVDNVIVYRDVYRGCSVNRTNRAVNFRFARNTSKTRLLVSRGDYQRLMGYNAATHGPRSRHKTWPVRNPFAARFGGHGRGVSGTGHAAGTGCSDQDFGERNVGRSGKETAV